ncbi:hypothetical protein E2C01_096494 [Portunus trituberculatus]|uniref:Uncharacterized protein n=1 Tax=Portunus trituberculatus TaxID=210409 RepID=A0A5B7K2X8_PORTR|nr:hypothetical protein [Portunus trituberculatus]
MNHKGRRHASFLQPVCFYPEPSTVSFEETRICLIPRVVIGKLRLRQCSNFDLRKRKGDAAVVQWNYVYFGIRVVSKPTGSNPVHGPSVGWASSLGATVS